MAHPTPNGRSRAAVRQQPTHGDPPDTGTARRTRRLGRHVLGIALVSLAVVIAPAAALGATTPSPTIAGAGALTVGELVSGGGNHIDFWHVSLTGGTQVQVELNNPSRGEYHFELYALGTTDATITLHPAVDAVGSNSESGRLTLQAPYTGEFVLAACENTGGGDCRTIFTNNSGANPMNPYTFITTLATPAPVTTTSNVTNGQSTPGGDGTPTSGARGSRPVKPRRLTRAQEYAAAKKACNKLKSRRQRARCLITAKKRYGTTKQKTT